MAPVAVFDAWMYATFCWLPVPAALMPSVAPTGSPFVPVRVTLTPFGWIGLSTCGVPAVLRLEAFAVS